MWYIYTMQYYSAIKRNEIMLSTATWMDLEIIMLSEVSQTMRHQHQMLSVICGVLREGAVNGCAGEIVTDCKRVMVSN